MLIWNFIETAYFKENNVTVSVKKTVFWNTRANFQNMKSITHQVTVILKLNFSEPKPQV